MTEQSTFMKRVSMTCRFFTTGTDTIQEDTSSSIFRQTMNHSKSSKVISNAVAARRLHIYQQRELRQQRFRTQTQPGGHPIPIVVALRQEQSTTRSSWMNRPDMVLLLDQALTINSEFATTKNLMLPL
jgi:hypothetical protein